MEEVNKLLVNFYLDEKYKEKMKYAHSSLGWVIRDEKIEFDHYNIYRENDIILDSEYRGFYDIKPKGSIENICEIFKNCIVGNIAMETVAVLGAAATVLSFSNIEWGTSIYNPLIHFMSNSSKGKSTGAMLYA